MDDCIFCQIVNNKLPAHIIYQENQVIAFLDNNPKEAGHILVIPKEHFSDLLEIPASLLATTIKAVQKVAQIINQKLSPDGLNICQNNGLLAGQTINHFHFHIIPCYQKKPAINKEDLQTIVKILKK